MGKIKEINKKFDLIEKYARILQKGLCGYLTKEGDKKTCDCKFLNDNFLDEKFSPMLGLSNGENTGCCEARSIIWEIQKIKKDYTQQILSLIEELEGKKKLEEATCLNCDRNIGQLDRDNIKKLVCICGQEYFG